MAKWSIYKFHEAMSRERDRVVQSEHLTEIERETFRAVLDEILQAVMEAEPPRMGHGERVNDEFIQALRDAVRDRQAYRRSLDRFAYTFIPFDHLTAEEISRGAGENVKVVDFRPPKDSK